MPVTVLPAAGKRIDDPALHWVAGARRFTPPWKQDVYTMRYGSACMSRAVLSIGSNLGDRLANLRLAVTEFGASVEAVSPVYETAPWGEQDQQDFLNAVLIVQHPEVDEWGWLRAGQRREQAAERVRERQWGPRTLDVDVITVDGTTREDAELRLPHPHAHQRAFVLTPWLDLEPDAELPGQGPVAKLLAGLPAEERAGVRARPDLKLA